MVIGAGHEQMLEYQGISVEGNRALHGNHKTESERNQAIKDFESKYGYRPGPDEDGGYGGNLSKRWAFRSGFSICGQVHNEILLSDLS